MKLLLDTHFLIWAANEPEHLAALSADLGTAKYQGTIGAMVKPAWALLVQDIENKNGGK